MMTVHQVSALAGVSVRTLHHYDAIGLLKATEVTEAGYRLYDEAALERLQSILLFRELEFPLKDIRRILDSPDFDRGKALEQQIRLLEMRKEHLQNLIDLARGMKMIGARPMSFEAFDTRKIDEYARQARESWGNTPEYQEFAQKDAARTDTDRQALSQDMMRIFEEFGALMKRAAPESGEAMALAHTLQRFITEHFYHCSDEILCCLGDMYAGGGEMTENIDKVGGAGTAEFACRAIRAMVAEKDG